MEVDAFVVPDDYDIYRDFKLVSRIETKINTTYLEMSGCDISFEMVIIFHVSYFE